MNEVNRCSDYQMVRGFAKLKKFKKKWIELTPPTHPHPNFYFIFGNPSLTWTEHSNHNNQQLLAMHNTDRIHMVYYSNVLALV